MPETKDLKDWDRDDWFVVIFWAVIFALLWGAFAFTVIGWIGTAVVGILAFIVSLLWGIRSGFTASVLLCSLIVYIGLTFLANDS